MMSGVSLYHWQQQQRKTLGESYRQAVASMYKAYDDLQRVEKASRDTKASASSRQISQEAAAVISQRFQALLGRVNTLHQRCRTQKLPVERSVMLFLKRWQAWNPTK